MKKKIVRKNIHLTLTFGSNSSRMLREIRSLYRLNLVDKVEVFSMYIPNIDNSELQSEKLIIANGVFNKLEAVSTIKFIKYLWFLLKSFSRYFLVNIHSIHCHSLHVLPVGVLLKIFS